MCVFVAVHESDAADKVRGAGLRILGNPINPLQIIQFETQPGPNLSAYASQIVSKRFLRAIKIRKSIGNIADDFLRITLQAADTVTPFIGHGKVPAPAVGFCAVEQFPDGEPFRFIGQHDGNHTWNHFPGGEHEDL